jgi:predicted phage tail protein
MKSIFKTNEGVLDRSIRGSAGAVLIGVSIFTTGGIQMAAAIAGGLLLFTAITGFCMLYTILGINTCPVKKS